MIYSWAHSLQGAVKGLIHYACSKCTGSGLVNHVPATSTRVNTSNLTAEFGLAMTCLADHAGEGSPALCLVHLTCTDPLFPRHVHGPLIQQPAHSAAAHPAKIRGGIVLPKLKRHGILPWLLSDEILCMSAGGVMHTHVCIPHNCSTLKATNS